MSKLKAKNDDVIREFLADPRFQVLANGTIVGKTIGLTTRGNQTYEYIRHNQVHLQVHRVIWAKYGATELDANLVINHKDGNGANNRIENLELISQSDNNKHRFRTLNLPPVKGHVKINQQIAELIRIDSSLGLSYSKLSDKYKISKSNVSSIVNYKTWRI